MKNRNGLAKVKESFWPVSGWKIIIRCSKCLPYVYRLAWVQTSQPGPAVTASFGFRSLRKLKEPNSLRKQLVYNTLRHAVIFQIDEAEVLEGFSHHHSRCRTYRYVTTRKSSEINNRNLFTGAEF